MKKLFILLIAFFFAYNLHAQASEWVEGSWDVFGDDMDSAKILCEKGYHLAQEKGDLKTMGRALAYRAIYYDIEAKADSALFLFYKALSIQESIRDTMGLITTYNNLGIFYFSQYQYTMATTYYKKAYETALTVNDYSSAAGSLINIGVIESYQPNGGNALDYYSEAERLYLLEGDSVGLLPIWSNTAKIYHDRGNYEQAYLLNLKSVQSPDENKSLSDWITERILMTNILYKMGRYAEAEKFGLQALEEAEKGNVPERKQYIYEALSNLYYAKNDYKRAFDFGTKYRDLRDSLINDSRTKQIAEMQTKYQSEKAVNEINKLKLEAQKRKNVELEKKRLQVGFYSVLIAGGIGLFGLAVFIILLIITLRLERTNSKLTLEKKKYAEQMLEKEKLLMRESHHRIKNNLQLINSILDLQSRNIKDVAIKEAFAESRQRIQAISFAHQRLYGDDTVEKLNLKSFLTDLSISIQSSSIHDSTHIKIIPQIEDISISTEKAIPIGLIVNELLTNSIKYAFRESAEGEIFIRLMNRGDQLELVIEDNGSGMKEEVEGTGFGHQLVKSMTRQLKAEYSLSLTSGVKHIFFIPIV